MTEACAVYVVVVLVPGRSCWRLLFFPYVLFSSCFTVLCSLSQWSAAMETASLWLHRCGRSFLNLGRTLDILPTCLWCMHRDPMAGQNALFCLAHGLQIIFSCVGLCKFSLTLCVLRICGHFILSSAVELRIKLLPAGRNQGLVSLIRETTVDALQKPYFLKQCKAAK